jgi:hypothetical protein
MSEHTAFQDKTVSANSAIPVSQVTEGYFPPHLVEVMQAKKDTKHKESNVVGDAIFSWHFK